MPLSTQARILRVLTEQSFVRVGGNRQIAGRRAGGLVDLARSREGDRREALPRGPVLPAQRGAGGDPLAGRAARRHSRARRPFLHPLRRRAGHAAARDLAPRRWRRCRPTTGRATCASCATWSSARSSSPRATGSARIEADMLPREDHRRPTGETAPGISALMGVPLREARESFEREYLRIQIRRFSGNISKTAGLHRDGALGAAPQAQAARHERRREGERRGLTTRNARGTASDLRNLRSADAPV